MPDALAVVLPHVTPHAAESAASFDWRYAAASVAFVGVIGGLVYWYFRRTAPSRRG